MEKNDLIQKKYYKYLTPTLLYNGREQTISPQALMKLMGNMSQLPIQLIGLRLYSETNKTIYLFEQVISTPWNLSAVEVIQKYLSRPYDTDFYLLGVYVPNEQENCTVLAQDIVDDIKRLRDSVKTVNQVILRKKYSEFKEITNAINDNFPNVKIITTDKF